MCPACVGEKPGNCYLGRNVSYETILEAFPKFVKDDGLISAFSGRIYPAAGSGTGRTGTGTRLLDFLLITKNHVVIWGRGLYGQTIDAIPYRDICSVTSARCLIFGEITITTRAGQKRFGDIYHEDVQVAITMIESRIRTTRNVSSGHTSDREPAEYPALRKYRDPVQIPSFNLVTIARHHG